MNKEDIFRNIFRDIKAKLNCSKMVLIWLFENPLSIRRSTLNWKLSTVPGILKTWLFFLPPALFPLPPPPPHEHQFYGLTSSFTRLIMKTKYVCHGLVYLHVNFHDNRTMQTVILIIKNSGSFPVPPPPFQIQF